MPKLTEQETPAELIHPAVAGVFVGGCVARGDGSRFRAKAHAHTQGEHSGWICILSARRLSSKMLMLHELAHIITGCGHTDPWRECLLALGGTLDEVWEGKDCILKSYHKRRRG